jgi:hypothetical protein
MTFVEKATDVKHETSLRASGHASSAPERPTRLPELSETDLRVLADKVLALFKEDLRVERERLGYRH